MEEIQNLMTIIPKINTELSYADLIKMRTEHHNEKEGTLEGYSCNKCKNKGDIAVIVDGVEAIRMCECMKIRETIKRFKTSGLGNQLRTCTFKSFEVKEEFQAILKNLANEFVKNEDAIGFYIGGQTGCGKTHICTAMVGQLIKQGKSARYMTWRDDSVVLKSYVNDKEYQTLINGYKQAEILYIDDLFKQDDVKDADKKLAFEIIDYRLRNRLKTIISSELDINDLIEIDEALGGRIIQMSGEYKLVIERDRRWNYRLKGA